MQKKKYYSRLEARQWPHEYFVRLDKDSANEMAVPVNQIARFRKWMRDNLIGPSKAEVSFLSTYDLVHVFIQDDDDAMLFKMRWSADLR